MNYKDLILQEKELQEDINNKLNQLKILNKNIVSTYLKDSDSIKIGSMFYNKEKELCVVSKIEYRKSMYGNKDREQEICLNIINLDQASTYYFASRDNSIHETSGISLNQFLKRENDIINVVSIDDVKEYVEHVSKLNSYIMSRLLFNQEAGSGFSLENMNDIDAKLNGNMPNVMRSVLDKIYNLKGLTKLGSEIIDLNCFINIEDADAFKKDYELQFKQKFGKDLDYFKDNANQYNITNVSKLNQVKNTYDQLLEDTMKRDFKFYDKWLDIKIDMETKFLNIDEINNDLNNRMLGE